MNKQIIFFLTVLAFFSNNAQSQQISFLGFDQQECEIISDYGYTHELIFCEGSNGYEIYKDSVKVYSICIYHIPIAVRSLLMTSDTSGFIVEDWNSVFKVITTKNSWESNSEFDGSDYGAHFLGFFLVSPNTGYLITCNHNMNRLWVRRMSNIRGSRFMFDNSPSEVVLQDTIYGEPYCELDTLGFKTIWQNDTTHYKIVLNRINADIAEKKELPPSLMPNPVSNFFGFSNTFDYTSLIEINIYNLNGKIIRSYEPYSGNNYFVGDLRNGLYFVELVSDKGKKVLKMIKI